MPASDITIRGAREHNLQSVDVVLPRNKLICLTGVSGSGKSSLAFDTLYAEGQRRYVESLSSFARQFLGQMPKPDVDLISGLSPSISISQKSSGSNPRSTVGTITEIYDYLRVLYARVGDGHCPNCDGAITAQTREQILTSILELPEGTRYSVLAPVIRAQKGEYRDFFEDLLKQGFVRARVDGEVVSLSDNLRLDRHMRHNIDVVIDRLASRGDVRARLAEAIELALKLGEGNLTILTEAGDSAREREIVFSAHYACAPCGISFEPPSPQMFSFNSPQGMCPGCDGLGELYTFDPQLLIPDDRRSFKQGAIELVGTWKSMGRWRRHIYQGVADTLERTGELKSGTILGTAWGDLDDRWREALLYGTGERHITFTWRGGSSPMKYGGTYEGIVPELDSKYRTSKSRPQLRKLEGYMQTMRCPQCAGQRLGAQGRAVRLITGQPDFQDRPFATLPEVCAMSVARAAHFFTDIRLDSTRALIAAEALKEIRGRLGFLMNVGLDYLTLDRTAPTLSGGESQRIRLAGQIGSGLVGVLYILDEPSIGLHPRDNHRLLETLRRLRDMGNTVVVVEHDEDTMRAADHIIDFGPGPGIRGGHVVVEGTPSRIIHSTDSITGKYLGGKLRIDIPQTRRAPDGRWLRVLGATHHNLREIDVEIPLGTFVCVTGVSGSGKSSLVNDVLVEALRRDLNGGLGEPGHHEKIDGLEHLDKLIAIDQTPIGRTPRSNPATYIKVFDEIRNLFAQLPAAKRRGYKPGRFSFNVKGGRCEACEGNGSTRLEMDFLADVWVTCPVCEGHRYNRETLQATFKDKSISEVLEMDVQQALELFDNIPKIRGKLQTLHDVGLDYLKLGQPSPTLSGGEAQRIKLAKQLVKKSTGKTLYLLDEPTTGLHFADIQLLLDVLQGFVAAGNTVLVVEHNLDVVKTADWIIDLGPEGGDGGGQVVAVGTPEQVTETAASHTGRALADVLAPRRRGRATRGGKTRSRGAVREATCIRVEGARQHNLKDVNAEIHRDRMTVFCGPSGSGKSSLAMDTIYAEGQRRYVESLSSYARQFVSQMQKPRLDHIDGLSPAIAIEQKNLGNTPRSTVGTVTEIYDYFRILMARLGTPYCPSCALPVGTQTSDEITDKILAEPAGTRLYLLAPIPWEGSRQIETVWEELKAAGYVRVRVNGETHNIDEAPSIDRRRRNDVEILIDRVEVKAAARSRIAESVENALAMGRGMVRVATVDRKRDETRWAVRTHSQFLSCESCGRSFESLTPHNFSFNSPLGWCRSCQGIGVETGANPAALLRDPKMTLAAGALRLWPDLAQPVSARMLKALGEGTGIPLDVPLNELSASHRRMVMRGTGDQWFGVVKGRGKKALTLFRFQYKGLYPAIEEASRKSPAFRNRLEQFIDEVECSSCVGSRLREDAAAVRFQGMSIDEYCRMPLGRLFRAIKDWKLQARDRKIAGEVLREIANRLEFLIDVGLEYLTLSRGAATLSNGEAQRIRLASQLGSGLCGVLYVLDEPTIGLHPRDNRRLLGALHKLRDLGNTLLVVEHDREVIEGCDYLCDFGPGAGKHGGQIVAHGTPAEVTRRRSSVTGPYLRGRKSIPIPSNRRMVAEAGHPSGNGQPPPAWQSPTGEWLEVVGARQNNLRNIRVRIPLATFTAITGPSGSGKSSLIDDILYRSLAKTLHRSSQVPGVHDEILGVEAINKVIRVDQQPLGNSPTSNPATYTGVFDPIRDLFANLPESKLRGYSARRFSFNVAGGRCDACEGNGQRCIEMHFLPDVWVECETCRGRRYNPETLAVTFHGHSIADVLELTCGEALRLFENVPKIRRVLETLCDVGLDYLTLGQSAPTLSGGEAQRVKLAAELGRPDTGRTLYLLDEPTTGLHFEDLAKLLDVLQRLVDLGNTVVLIEHNLDVIKTADWVIDFGPEAGDGGGQVVWAGPPEHLVAYAAAAASSTSPRSYTGEALADVLEGGPYVERKPYDFEAAQRARDGDVAISQIGREAKMPWEIDGQRWHTKERLSRNGEPCQWDGRILAEVVDRIEQCGEFDDTNWNARSIVEVTGPKKSLGWFFHALTGETWLLKLKFRVRKGTFKAQELTDELNFKTLNQRDDIPMYSNSSRVKVSNLRGPWQEVQLKLFDWQEVDRPEFWDFLRRAVDGFVQWTAEAEKSIEDHMPWKKLGQKWHLSRKGFPPGKRVLWNVGVLELLCEALAGVAGDGGQFLWNNQVLVHFLVEPMREPWATIHTKRLHSVELTLNGPKNAIALGRFAQLGHDRDVDATRPDRDQIKLQFRTQEEVTYNDLSEALAEHLAACMSVFAHD